MPILLFLLSPVFTYASPATVTQAFDTVRSFYQEDLARYGLEEFTMHYGEETTVAAVNTMGKKALLQVNEELSQDDRLGLDQWTAILCHETGHLIGGAPYIAESVDDRNEFSAEGQADYFAAAKCLRRIWSDEQANRVIVTGMPPALVGSIRLQGCVTDQCVRIVATSYSIFQALNPEETMKINERSKVKAKETHSSRTSLPAQCRLDTYLAGALCPVDPAASFSPSNQRDGACTADSADPTVIKGSRPACWFAPYDLDGTY
jgi:hypothetical protein